MQQRSDSPKEISADDVTRQEEEHNKRVREKLDEDDKDTKKSFLNIYNSLFERE